MSTDDVHIAYIDCFSGISGDMFLASFIDAGLPLKHLKEQLKKIDLKGYRLTTATTNKQGGIKATKFAVNVSENHPHRSWQTIELMLLRSELPQSVKRRALSIFTVLAKAEAKVHGCKIKDAHFHEVGAVDSIIDIVGAAVALEYFNIDHIFSAPLPVSRGWVKCEHGLLPLPAPAVCELLHDIPVQGCTVQQELVTPTGAALLKGLSAEFGPFPSMIIEHIGYGAGEHIRDDKKPNLLRVVLGRRKMVQEHQCVEIIEANLDDWSPESFPYICEKLMNLGALDVTLAQVLMKKGRPGFQIQVIAAPGNAMELKNAILSETTTIGLRYRTESRMTLPRQAGTIPTKWGNLHVKLVHAPAGVCIYPEYEACKEMAIKQGVAIKEIYRLAAASSIDQFSLTEAQVSRRRKKRPTDK
jgi:hypothetical protein